MFVFSNLATSLDGKIATARREAAFLGTPADRRQMQALRRKCDVLLMGAGTLRSYRKFCGVRSASSSRQITNAILSSDLAGVSPDWPFFSDPSLKRILFVTGNPPASRLRAFAKTSSEVVFLREKKPVARQILSALKKRGYSRLLVEGGGELMWHFAEQNLIDEYNVTLTPKIVGGKDSPTLVEGPGFKAAKILQLKLHRCKRLGDELYLVYRKTR